MNSVASESIGSVHTRRVVAAAPEALFQAWTDPDEFADWWRPGEFVTTAAEMDVRVGGKYRITMEDGDGSRQYLFGTYLEVQPPRRLAMTWTLEGSEKDDGYAAVLTLEFRPLKGGTEIELTHEKLPTRSMDMYAAGWVQVLDELTAHLA